MTVSSRDDLDEIRAALAARTDSCWERLADAVSELSTLHQAPLETLIAAVRDVYEAEAAGGE